MRRVSSNTPKRSRTQIRTGLHRALLLIPLVPLAAVASLCTESISAGPYSGRLIGVMPATDEERAEGRTGPRGYYRMNDGSTLVVDCSDNTSSGSVMLGESA